MSGFLGTQFVKDGQTYLKLTMTISPHLSYMPLWHVGYATIIHFVCFLNSVHMIVQLLLFSSSITYKQQLV